MTQVIVWRHGRTEWNATGRVQGHSDVALDEIGLAQAERAAQTLVARKPTLIIASDLRRAARTAQPLADLTGLPVDVDPRLRERHYGPWEGLDHTQIQAQFPDDYARWGRSEPLHNPEIETVEMLAERVCAALEDAAKRAENGLVVVVTHGGAARVGCARLLGWPPEIWQSFSGLLNCHHTELRHSHRRGWQLRAHNVP